MFVKIILKGFSDSSMWNTGTVFARGWSSFSFIEEDDLRWIGNRHREDLLKSVDVQHMIAERAYHISLSRSFEDGHETEDWLQAEHDILEFLQREHEARNAEPPAASALALTDSAIFEEPVAAPIPSSAESADAPARTVKKASAKKSAATKRAPKTATPKAKSASTKSPESKSVKTTASKPKPILRKASKKPPATNPSS